MNKRVTPKERGLLKGAIRRVFSRSELRLKVMAAAKIEHHDPKRPRVKKWVRCSGCKEPVAQYQAAVDHIDPVIPVTTTFEQMSLDTVVDRMWCEENNLQILCELCHNAKTRLEKAQRPKVTRKKVKKKDT